MKIWSFHIPVRIARLRVQYIFVGEQLTEDLADFRQVFLGYPDVGFHNEFVWFEMKSRSNRFQGVFSRTNITKTGKEQGPAARLQRTVGAGCPVIAIRIF